MIRFSIILILLQLFFASAFGLSKPLDPADSITLSDKIHAKAAEIMQSGRTTDQLSEQDLANLPVGILKEVGAATYMIIVDSVRFTPQGAYMNVYASLQMGETEKHLAFGATNIMFQPGGLSTSVSTKLQLVSTERIPFGKDIDLILSPNGYNYVEFDCNGFKSVNVKGLFEFSRDILVPVDEKNDKVRAVVEGNFTDLNNIIASLSIEAFRPKKFQEISVDVEEAVVDFSDMANPTAVIFPEEYAMQGANPAFWRGFFIKKAKVTLPKKLNSGKGIQIEANNLIIDKKGFSGMIGAANLFSTDDGNLNGWPFSIDSLGISIIKNQLTGAGFRGLMVVPPFDKESPLRYTALISTSDNDSSSFLFYLEPTEALKASALMAEITLKEGSSILVKEVNGELQPEAMLHGFISVKSGNRVNLKKLEFQNLHLASEKPYVRSGVWSMTGEGEQSLGNFPIAIQDVKMAHANDQIKLSLNVMLNLMDNDHAGFAASTTVAVEAEMADVPQLQGEQTVYIQRWQHSKTGISAASIDFQSEAFGIRGSVEFYEDDPVMGNGFRGEVDARFANDRFRFKAIGQFGKVNNYKYWYVDALMKFDPALGQGFGLYGIGGGMYYHMKIEDLPRQDPSQFISVQGNQDNYNVGQSRSQIKYIPDKNAGIGFKASCIVGTTAKEKLLNGVATFEMAFFQGGGINYIRFLGDAYFMKDIDAPAETSQMYASLNVNVDFVNDELHGELATYIKVGNNVLRGAHQDGLAGKAILHVDKSDWYIHVGTPSQRISVNMLGVVQTGSYFMAGTYIHDFPSVTDVVPDRSLVSKIENDLDGFMRDENALGSGGGVAFGASLALSTGKMQYMIFYGLFDAGFGFDVMLRDYGGAHCAGETEPVGINGWYASGQAWLYLRGDIGIRVQLKFIEGEFSIMKVSMASIVQAKLPNPTFVQGFVAGKYNILGGMVKGDFNFKVTVGQQCEMTGASTLGVKVIAEMQPKGSEKIDVFTAPQVAFNVPVNKTFELLDDNTGKSKAYQVKLDHFQVMNAAEMVVGDIEYNEDNKVAIFNSFEVLPPNSQLKATVKVSWHERVNGSWQPLGGENQESETDEISFTTGEAPDYIPESNVAYAYPMTGMANFYQDEYEEGYLVLNRGQAYLFEKEEEYAFETRLTPVGFLSASKVPLEYNAGKKLITYTIPDQLQTDRNFELSFVKYPKSQYQIDQNINQVEEVISASADANIIVTTQDIDGVVLLQEEEHLYKTYFATSQYKTFNEKLNSFTSPLDVISFIEAWNISRIGLLVRPVEGFDKAEAEGKGDNIAPLVQFGALPDNEWYNKVAYPLNYEHYPVNQDMKITWRSDKPLGLPPVKALHIWQENDFPSVTPENLYAARATNSRGDMIIYYDLAFIALQDFLHLQSKAFDLYLQDMNNAPAGASYLMKNGFTGYSVGNYPFKISYNLPGRNITTTERSYTAKKK